jgi:hypothetical protein
MEAFSIDLRVRVLADYDAGPSTSEVAAKQHVSESWAAGSGGGGGKRERSPPRPVRLHRRTSGEHAGQSGGLATAHPGHRAGKRHARPGRDGAGRLGQGGLSLQPRVKGGASCLCARFGRGMGDDPRNRESYPVGIGVIGNREVRHGRRIEIPRQRGRHHLPDRPVGGYRDTDADFLTGIATFGPTTTPWSGPSSSGRRTGSRRNGRSRRHWPIERIPRGP